jgi:predicted thioesterase
MTYEQEMTVTELHTAEKLGSGSLSVFATPALVAFMENTAMKLLADLPESETSVGVSINIQHLKASAIGEKIRCTAKITEIDGRKYTFYLEAIDSSDAIIGKGTHERFVVNVEKFMGKLSESGFSGLKN